MDEPTDANTPKKVDILEQVKEAHLASYAQALQSMMQQCSHFNAAGLVRLKHVAENGEGTDFDKALKSNLKGFKAIVDTNKYLLDASVDSIEKLEQLMKKEGDPKNG